jgi:pyridoxamine 5'-phosphate oxidase family protein
MIVERSGRLARISLVFFVLWGGLFFSSLRTVQAGESRQPPVSKAGDAVQAKSSPAMFSEKEVAYVKSQRLARIATVSKKQQPDVAPVSFEFDGQYFYVGGKNNPITMKYRNVAAGNSRVALVFDDWESLKPWTPRSIKIHGTAELVKRNGQLGEGEYLRITPVVKWSMGVDEPAFQDGKPVIKKIKR